MSLWRRITPEEDKSAEAEVKAGENKSKEPPIEFFPEEPKYSFNG